MLANLEVLLSCLLLIIWGSYIEAFLMISPLRRSNLEKSSTFWCSSFDRSLSKTGSYALREKSENDNDVAYGPDSFGDIMSKKETNISVVGEFTPLERIVITANGNLQRILSAYYGAPIAVVINKCKKVTDSKYDREVDLVVHGQVLCTALGQIILHSDECVEAIESKSIGVGQLFRFLGVLPTFTLLAVGRANNQLWREYELSCPQLKCTFTETFKENFLDIDCISTFLDDFENN